MGRQFLLRIFSVLLFAGPLAAQESIDALVERGGELFHADIGCWVCHSETGEGLVGPRLHPVVHVGQLALRLVQLLAGLYQRLLRGIVLAFGRAQVGLYNKSLFVQLLEPLLSRFGTNPVVSQSSGRLTMFFRTPTYLLVKLSDGFIQTGHFPLIGGNRLIQFDDLLPQIP